jgi:hypothetical protein
MLLKPRAVMAVPDVPVGSFFYMKLQGQDVYCGFMAQLTGQKDGEFTGPVVLILPQKGGLVAPRPAAAYQLAVAAVIAEVEPFVDFDTIESSSTEAMALPLGQLLACNGDFLFPTGGDNYVTFKGAEYVIGGEAGPWLGFTRWGLRLLDGTIAYCHDSKED